MTHIVLLGAVFALFAFLYFLHRFSTAWSMRDWRRTEGRVVMAEMRRGKQKSQDGCLLYDPALRYSYAVSSHAFEGSRFTHQAVSNAASRTTQFITRLTQGSKVPVCYHPRNPEEAMVQPLSWQGSAMAALVCALLLILLAAILWLS